MDRLQELVRLHRLGVKARERARQLQLSPNTERKYRHALQQAGLWEGSAQALPELSELKAAVLAALPEKAAAEAQISKIEGWREAIESLMQEGVGPKEIHRRLRKEGHEGELLQGSYSQVKRLVTSIRRARGVRAEEVAIPVQTAPGEVVQVDFGYVGKLLCPERHVLRKAWVFVAVLGYSRWTWAQIVFDQKVQTWLRLHVELIESLGGVPRVFVPDNLKAAVVRAAFTPKEATALNRSYRELARHYGFRIDPTPPYAPQKKGKVESAVKYLKGSVLKGRQGQDAEQVGGLLQRFLETEANVREHGTTRKVPLDQLRLERPHFGPLPEVRYAPILWRQAKVHTDCHISFDKKLYSVPWRLVGQKVWVRASPESLYVYADEERVATHPRRVQGPRSTQEAHLPEGRRDLRHRSREHWQTRAAKMGEPVAQLIDAIFDADEVLSQLRTVQAIVTYLEPFPRHRVQAAARRALFYGVDTYPGIKRILVKGLDLEPLPNAVLPVQGRLEQPTFARSVPDLLWLSGPEASHEPH